MISWKYPASWALAIASALIMAAPAQCEEFFLPSIEGTYVLIQSIPEVNMEAREFAKDLFFPYQKIHFDDYGVMKEEGYDIFQGQQKLLLTIYPPFSNGHVSAGSLGRQMSKRWHLYSFHSDKARNGRKNESTF
ncbi:MAG: hypothetical protein ACTTKK_01245 [Ottowia sp.]